MNSVGRSVGRLVGRSVMILEKARSCTFLPYLSTCLRFDLTWSIGTELGDKEPEGQSQTLDAQLELT